MYWMLQTRPHNRAAVGSDTVLTPLWKLTIQDSFRPHPHREQWPTHSVWKQPHEGGCGLQGELGKHALLYTQFSPFIAKGVITWVKFLQNFKGKKGPLSIINSAAMYEACSHRSLSAYQHAKSVWPTGTHCAICVGKSFTHATSQSCGVILKWLDFTCEIRTTVNVLR